MARADASKSPAEAGHCPASATPERSELLGRLRAAQHLLKSEQVGPAHSAYEGLLPHAPFDADVVFPLAVLKYHLGEDAAATGLVTDYFRHRPLRELTQGASRARPLMLKVRGYNLTRPHLTKSESGEVSFGMRGGHFTTEYLLDGADIAECEYTIAGAGPVQPDKMPPHDVLVNTISEADLEAPALNALEAYLKMQDHAPVINRPDRVRRTTRDGNFDRLTGIQDLTFPRTKRLTFSGATTADVRNALEKHGFDAPVILRRTGTQTGRTTALVTSDADLQDYVAEGLHGEFYAISYRELLWKDQYFRKLRLFCIDGQFYPVVCHLDLVWNVHGANRKDVMRANPDLMQEEQRFLSDWQDYCGTRAVAALEQAAEDTGLEFFGIDFTLDEDDLPFIFELNATMRHSFDHGRNFPYKQPYDRAISDAFAAMIRQRMSGTIQAAG